MYSKSFSVFVISGKFRSLWPQSKCDGVRGGPSSMSVYGYVRGRLLSVASISASTVFSSITFSDVFPVVVFHVNLYLEEGFFNIGSERYCMQPEF